MARFTTPEMKTAARERINSEAKDTIVRDVSRRIGRLAQQLGERYSPRRCSLDTYEVYDAKQKPVVARLKALDLSALVESGCGVMLYGSIGTGKDHLLAAMLYSAAAAGVDPIAWTNGQEVFGAFRDGIDSGKAESTLLAELSAPSLLAISDPIPPRGQPSAWNVQQLYRLLDRRNRSMKSTWVTLNAMSPEDAEAKLSGPVFDRLAEGAVKLPCFWQSHRERGQG